MRFGVLGMVLGGVPNAVSEGVRMSNFPHFWVGPVVILWRIPIKLVHVRVGRILANLHLRQSRLRKSSRK